MNDVGNSVPNIPVKLYADDTNLLIYGKTTDILINNTQSSLTKPGTLYITGQETLRITA